MMKKIIFITPEDAEYGFRLAGVGHVVASEKDVEVAFQKELNDPGTGMLVVDERLLSNYPWERLRELERNFEGIFLVLPSPVRPAPEAEDFASRLIRQAIGYHVRL